MTTGPLRNATQRTASLNIYHTIIDHLALIMQIMINEKIAEVFRKFVHTCAFVDRKVLWEISVGAGVLYNNVNKVYLPSRNLREARAASHT